MHYAYRSAQRLAAPGGPHAVQGLARPRWGAAGSASRPRWGATDLGPGEPREAVGMPASDEAGQPDAALGLFTRARAQAKQVQPIPQTVGSIKENI